MFSSGPSKSKMYSTYRVMPYQKLTWASLFILQQKNYRNNFGFSHSLSFCDYLSCKIRRGQKLQSGVYRNKIRRIAVYISSKKHI